MKNAFNSTLLKAAILSTALGLGACNGGDAESAGIGNGGNGTQTPELAFEVQGSATAVEVLELAESTREDLAVGTYELSCKTEVIDSEAIQNLNYGWSSGITGNAFMAQSVTVPIGGWISSLKLALNSNGDTVNVTVYREGLPGDAGSMLIGSASALVDGGPAGWVDFAFSPAIAVEAGEVIYIAANAPDGTDALMYQPAVAASTYDGGIPYKSNDGGATFSVESGGYDYAFDITVEAHSYLYTYNGVEAPLLTSFMPGKQITINGNEAGVLTFKLLNAPPASATAADTIRVFEEWTQ